MTNPQRIGTDLAEQKVLADIAEYGWRLLRLAGLFVQRADLRCIPGLTSALAACAERNTSAPGDGESEAWLRLASRIFGQSAYEPVATATLRNPASLRPAATSVSRRSPRCCSPIWQGVPAP